MFLFPCLLRNASLLNAINSTRLQTFQGWFIRNILLEAKHCLSVTTLLPNIKIQLKYKRAKCYSPSSIASRLSISGGRRWTWPDLPPVFIHVGATLVIHFTRIEPFRKYEPSKITSKPKIVCIKPCWCITSGKGVDKLFST